jgi:hydroxylamine dehydrogenase
MTLNQKRTIIAVLAGAFLVSLLFVQWREVDRKAEEAGLKDAHVTVPASSVECVDCHGEANAGIIEHWKGSTHAESGIGCVECHQADVDDADSYEHYGQQIATIGTPRDCARCHPAVTAEFDASHHSRAGDILASLDNFLAESVEGNREDFSPHSPTPGLDVDKVVGMSSANSGCKQCHGAAVAFEGKDGSLITYEELQPDEDGKPTNQAAVANILKDEDGIPQLSAQTWPNTGIGRLNLDGSKGSCSACHSRHDFSRRRARQPENCGKCHMGPDHPQKEVFEESKHGIAYRDLKDELNLDSKEWVLGVDYSAAPTCASCHMSGNKENGGVITHDPGERISWTNRPPVSVRMDTDKDHHIVKETDPAKRAQLIDDTADQKRQRMKQACATCHSEGYVNNFYEQYDNLVILYNEKFAKPGRDIMAALKDNGLITPTQFDEEIEFTWFYLWHHEGRRARHGASMMAPDYTHWHGMYEVAERFYMELIPQAREITHEAHDKAAAAKVDAVIDGVLARPEHSWFTEGDEEAMEAIRKAMEERYGKQK